MNSGQTTRRTTLGTALAVTMGGAALTGCDLDPRDSDEPEQSPDQQPPVDADQTLVEDVARGLQLAIAQVTALRQRDRSLRRPAGDLLALHEAHLRALDVEPDPKTRLETSPGKDAGKALRSFEIKLQRALAQAAIRAESGALAKLFASMSAAVSQRVVNL